jgi:hypothetical protein
MRRGATAAVGSTSPRDLGFDELREQGERLLPAEIAGLRGMAASSPSWTTVSSVPKDIFFSDTVVCISPGMVGSSNVSVLRMRSCGTSSR